MLYLKNYGAAGDGVTDDSAAILSALADLKRSGVGSSLQLESNKTYYAAYVGRNAKALIELDRVKGLTVQGNGSTILMGSHAPYVYVTGTKNCAVKGLTFDYAQKPAFSATCSSITPADGTAVMIADRDIGLKNGEIYTPPTGVSYWGALNKQDSRYHMFITKIQMINTEKRTFRVTFDTDDANTARWLESSLSEYGLICPMPRVGQLPANERAFTVVSNVDFSMADVKINSCCRFGMFVADNEGTVRFEHVDFVPADNELDGVVNFTSWRDAWHCKDNRAKIVWDHCTAVGNYDDVINISSSALTVTDYDKADKRLTLVWQESGSGLYYSIRPGDRLSVIDTDTGADCGTVAVASVIKQADGVNVITVDSPLTDFTIAGKNIQAFFTNRCAPDSVISNCDFGGTFRFRGPLTVTDSNFYNMRMWIDLYDAVEGPVPQDIHFIRCDIESALGATIILDSYNTKSASGYRLRNISFEDCVLESDALLIGKNDTAGVKLIRCTRHDGIDIS